MSEKKEYIAPEVETIENIKNNREALLNFISDLMDKYAIADREARHWKKEYMNEYKNFCDLQDKYNKLVNENKQSRAILDSHILNMTKILKVVNK